MSAPLATTQEDKAMPTTTGDVIPAFRYESLRAMPTLVRVLAYQHKAWVVGGAAKFMCGIGPTPRDWDVIVPESEWSAASKHFPYGATVNTLGGIKATSDGCEVDIWASDLGRHWVTSFGDFDLLAVSPATQQVSVCSRR
jgi:hypothetical protein